MAKKKKSIHIEEFGFYDNRFAIYSDLSRYDLNSIEGVCHVCDVMLDEGYLTVTIDKRYDIQEVLREIEVLGSSDEDQVFNSLHLPFMRLANFIKNRG